MPKEFNFLSQLTGSFGRAAAGNATVAMIEEAYRHHEMDWRYLNCEVSPERLGDAVRGARRRRLSVPSGSSCDRRPCGPPVRQQERPDAVGTGGGAVGRPDHRRGTGSPGQDSGGSPGD